MRASTRGSVEIRVHDTLRRDHPGGLRQAIEHRCELQQNFRCDAGFAQRSPAMTRVERQHRGHRADLAEEHVPAGHSVLRRRKAGEKRGDRRRCGGRKHRGEPRAQVVPEGGRDIGSHQVAIAKAVDHEQDKIARFGETRGIEICEQGVAGRHAATGGDHRRHEIDDTLALVVGQDVRVSAPRRSRSSRRYRRRNALGRARQQRVARPATVRPSPCSRAAPRRAPTR